MGEVPYRSHPYIQLEEAMKSFANASFSCRDDRTKPKL